MLFSIDAYLVPVSLFRLHSERRAVHENSSLTLLVFNKMLIADGDYKWSQGMRLYVCSYGDMVGVCACSSLSVLRPQPQVLSLRTFPFLFETESLLSLKCRPED